MVPSLAQFTKEDNKLWSAKISEFDGYIFVTPEYNSNVPGTIKNGIDYLYNELWGKPAMVVTYEGMKLFVCLAFLCGSGPDVLAAMGSGTLRDDTTALWITEIAKGYEELKQKLLLPTVQKPSKVSVVAAKLVVHRALSRRFV